MTSHIANLKLAETSLYAPVKAFLEDQGFEAKGEICGCDIVAVRLGEPPIFVITKLKLKLSFTLELVLQAVDRRRAADQVYLAITASRRGRDQDARVQRLCRLLGLGLLLVDTRQDTVAGAAEPVPYRPRPDVANCKRLLREHELRQGDPTMGGSARQPIMTAYRQRALRCAIVMAEGPKRPRDLEPLAEDAGSILLRNVYGWFDRVHPGLYQLSSSGRCAAERATPACDAGESRKIISSDDDLRSAR